MGREREREGREWGGEEEGRKQGVCGGGEEE